jgi:hypothetical protein
MQTLGVTILVLAFLVGLSFLIGRVSSRRDRPSPAAERTEGLKARLRERKIDRIRLTDRLKEWEDSRRRGDRPPHTWGCRYLDNGYCDCDEYATRDYLDHVEEKIAIIEDELKPRRERKGLLAGQPDYVWDSSTINRHSEASRKRREEFQRQQEAYWDQRIAQDDQQRGNLS